MEHFTTSDTILHQAVMNILRKVEYLDAKLSKMYRPEHEKGASAWLNVAALQSYFPNRHKKQTNYSWTTARKIPFHKKGRLILHNEDEIAATLHNSTIKIYKLESKIS